MALRGKNKTVLASLRVQELRADKFHARSLFDGVYGPKDPTAAVKRLSLPELDKLTERTAHDVLRHANYECSRHLFSPLLKLYESRSKAGKLTPKHAAMIIKHANLALKYNNPETAFQILKHGIRAGAITNAHSSALLKIAEDVALPPKGELRNNKAYVNTIGGDLLDLAVSRGVLGKAHVKPLLKIAGGYADGRPDTAAPFYAAAIKAGNLDPAQYGNVFYRMSTKKSLSTGVGVSDNPLRSAVVLKHGVASGALSVSAVKPLFSELKKDADRQFLVWGTKPGEEIVAIAKKYGVTV